MAKKDKPLFSGKLQRETVQDYVQLKAGPDGLVEAQADFTIHEYRVFFQLLRMLHKDDDEFALQQVSIQDIIKEYRLTHAGYHYNLLREAVFSLFHREFSRIGIIEGKEHKITVPVLDKRAEPVVEKDQTHIWVRFHPDLKPYLLQLKSEYLSISMKYLYRLNSPYSIKLYMILKHRLRQNTKHPRYEIPDLRFMLSIPDGTYSNYSDFKHRVLLRCMQEINAETDLRIHSITELRKGRIAHTVCFVLDHNTEVPLVTETPTLVGLDASPAVQEEIDPLFTRFRPFHVSRNTFDGWINRYGREHVEAIAQVGLHYLSQNEKIKNPVGYLNKLMGNEDLAKENKKRTETPVEAPKVVHKAPTLKPQVNPLEAEIEALRELYSRKLNDAISDHLLNPEVAGDFFDYVDELRGVSNLPINLELGISIFDKKGFTVETLGEGLRSETSMLMGLKMKFFEEYCSFQYKQLQESFEPLARNLKIKLW